MHSRVIPVLCLLLLVPLAVQAAPSEVEARLPVLEPVWVRPHRGEWGAGLKLTFEPLRPNPALALFTLEEAREVVAALEGGFKAARPGPRSPAAATLGALSAGMVVGSAPKAWSSDLERHKLATRTP